MKNSDFTAGPIISKSFASVFKHFNFFGLLAIIFIIITSVLMSVVSTDSESQSITMTTTLVTICMEVFLIGLYSRFAVMVHRAIILEEYQITKIFEWSKKDVMFLLWIFATIAVVVIVFLVVSILIGLSENVNVFVSVLRIVVFIATAIAVSRLAIVFPSIAIDKRVSITEAWKVTRFNKISMFLLVIGFPYLINKLMDYLPSDDVFWLLISTSLAVFVTILEIVIVSHCFSELTDTETVVDSNE